ncbi:MAG: hypothetical protein AAFN94_02475 [Pseudomonadota bacterium]
MSAPDTNIEKEVRRHRPALYGIAAVTAAVLVFIVAAQTAPEDDAPVMATEVSASQ